MLSNNRRLIQLLIHPITTDNYGLIGYLHVYACAPFAITERIKMGSKPKVVQGPTAEEQAKLAADQAALETNADQALRKRQRKSTILSSLDMTAPQQTALGKTNTGT